MGGGEGGRDRGAVYSILSVVRRHSLKTGNAHCTRVSEVFRKNNDNTPVFFVAKRHNSALFFHKSTINGPFSTFIVNTQNFRDTFLSLKYFCFQCVGISFLLKFSFLAQLDKIAKSNNDLYSRLLYSSF